MPDRCRKSLRNLPGKPRVAYPSEAPSIGSRQLLHLWATALGQDHSWCTSEEVARPSGRRHELLLAASRVPLLHEEDAFDVVERDQRRDQNAQLRVPDPQLEAVALGAPALVPIGADHLAVLEPDDDLGQAAPCSRIAVLACLHVARVDEHVLDRRERDPDERVVAAGGNDRETHLHQRQRRRIAIDAFAVGKVDSDLHINRAPSGKQSESNALASRFSTGAPLSTRISRTRTHAGPRRSPPLDAPLPAWHGRGRRRTSDGRMRWAARHSGAWSPSTALPGRRPR